MNTRWQIGSAVLLSLIVATTAIPAAADKKKKPDDPTPRREPILKLFVDEFVPITPGMGKFPESFLMGSKTGRNNEKPVHKVTFKYSFAIAKYEVTQELYHVVVGKNPARWPGPRNSVEMVNHAEAKEFCRLVTKELRDRKLIGAKEEIRLPSEAEWEYCCRAGTTTDYSFGDDDKELGKCPWLKDNAPGNDPPVGVKLGNPWGLLGLHGYVWEWCLDDYFPSYEGAPSDGSPRKTAEAEGHVMRGGGFSDPAEKQRSAYRHFGPDDLRSDAIGFRCVKAAVRE